MGNIEGGMTKTKIEKASNYMGHNETFNHLLTRERIRILTRSPRKVHLPYSIGTLKVCLLKRMRFMCNLQFLRRINLRVRFIVKILNVLLVHTFGIRSLNEIVGVILYTQKNIIPLIDKGRDSSTRQTNNEGLTI